MFTPPAASWGPWWGCWEGQTGSWSAPWWRASQSIPPEQALLSQSHLPPQLAEEKPGFNSFIVGMNRRWLCTLMVGLRRVVWVASGRTGIRARQEIASKPESESSWVSTWLNIAWYWFKPEVLYSLATRSSSSSVLHYWKKSFWHWKVSLAWTWFQGDPTTLAQTSLLSGRVSPVQPLNASNKIKKLTSSARSSCRDPSFSSLLAFCYH